MTKNFNFKVDWLFLFILLLPTFYIPGLDVRHTQTNFFQISMFVLLAIFHVNRFFGLFLLWATIQFVFFDKIPNDSMTLQNIFFAAFLYHFISKYATLSKKYLWALSLVLALSVLWIPLQIFQHDPIFVPVSTNPYVSQTVITDFAGFFGMTAAMGNYAAMVMPFAFILNPVLIPVCLIGLFFSKSSFSIVAALVASLFFFWFRKRIIFWAILLIFGTSSAVYVLKYDMPHGQFSRRAHVWELILKEACMKQFLGHGIGSYNSEYVFIESSKTLHNTMATNPAQLLKFLAEDSKDNPKVLDFISRMNPNQADFASVRDVMMKEGLDFHPWAEAHNDFLQVFFEFGLIGLVLIGWYIYDIFKRFFKLGLEKNWFALSLLSSFIAILIVTNGHFTFHLTKLGGPAIVVMALLETCIFKAEAE